MAGHILRRTVPGPKARSKSEILLGGTLATYTKVREWIRLCLPVNDLVGGWGGGMVKTTYSRALNET